MASLTKVLRLSNSVNNVKKLFTNLSVCQNVVPSLHSKVPNVPTIPRSALIHTSSRTDDLMEFFDKDINWTKQRIQVGRSWSTDELRIKSNEDLHKLWYVLLKEKNMLLTMEHACNEAYELFPNPERLDKVEESMKNLETVVRERNEAYYQLETGQTGEVPSKIVNNVLGLRQYYRFSQHVIPKGINQTWKKKYLFGYGGHAVRKFLLKYRENIWNEKRKRNNRETNAAISLLKKFPNLDMEALRQKYPNANIEKALRSNKLKYHGVASRYE
ncbi:39S ribosomal protein L47, mitochondrial [Copidosoma floridanum]|uniref:39S ribosomal protein L47, mitochondrial n=1 Tax=Copidosoma floridanum TaxID=29053 RepID=UPI0006C99B82|nr:39S ribosomal protein L47, mitochondrial [Copidosoma floridanum]